MQNIFVNTSFSTIKFVSEYYKPQEIFDKAVDSWVFIFDSISDQYKIQEMCDKAVPNDLFILKYGLDSYKIEELLPNQKSFFFLHRW